MCPNHLEPLTREMVCHPLNVSCEGCAAAERGSPVLTYTNCTLVWGLRREKEVNTVYTFTQRFPS